jgi:hypothetical protein
MEPTHLSARNKKMLKLLKEVLLKTTIQMRTQVTKKISKLMKKRRLCKMKLMKLTRLKTRS